MTTPYKPFSAYYNEELPMITVNLLNEIVDFNFSSTKEINMHIGDVVQLRPLSHSYDKSFPYTAVLTVNEKEYLACVTSLNKATQQIYFSDIFSSSSDELLLARYMIEYKYAEKARGVKRSLSASHASSAIDFFGSIALLSGSNAHDDRRHVSKEDIACYIDSVVQRYKEKFSEKNDISYSFICEENTVFMSENILSGIVALIILSMSVAKKHFSFEIFEKLGNSAFCVILDGVKITESLFSLGFPGLFLSHMEKLNTWKTEQTYSASKMQTVISVTVSRTTNHCRLHSKRIPPNYAKYASFITEIMLLP